MGRFPDGARVAFVGDSLIAENLQLKMLIDFYERSFVGADVRFFNCGIAGGTAESALRFLDEDVMRHKPTHVVLSTGVNDSERWHLSLPRSKERYELLKSAYDNFRERIPILVNELRSRGVELIICTPPPYDEYTETTEPPFKGGYALVMAFADFVRDYATKEGIELCDYHKFFTEILQQDPCYSADHIHPDRHGYYLLTKCFLEHQGLVAPEEAPLPECFSRWSQRVSTLRTVYGAEYMLIKDPNLTEQQRIELMKKKVITADWGQPVFERFVRCYAENKPKAEQLYKEIDELYESDVLAYYRG